MIDTYGKLPPRSLELVTTADLHLAWDVPYQPGTLRAIGRKDGRILKLLEVSTTGPAAAIRLTVDEARLTTSREDVAHVKVEVTDEQGRMVPTADDPLTFAVSGSGRILGLDNGCPDSHEGYQGTERRAFNGLALVMLQSTGVTGAVRLSASAPGLR